MNNDPCKVCGNTDMNLLDGFYFCVECGTQDTNLMETLVEDIMLKDGTFAIRQKTKVKKLIRVVEKVSPEWYKWQTCNYILSGMVKEMMDLGAGPKFKMRVMWLWTLYVKRFQNKQELGLSADADEQMEYSISYNRIHPLKKPTKFVNLQVDIRKVTLNVLVTIIYLALNFDRSDILVSDLVRFIREGRLSYKNFLKHVPEEIDITKFEESNVLAPFKNPNVEYINTQAMTILKTLDLGCPIVPNLRKIVERYVKELCLPEEFKELVFSLMNVVPCDYLEIDRFIMSKINTIPFYEAQVMAFILVALKMCFGLDDEYENKLSDAVDYINNENCHMKCYKLGGISTCSDRLFSFREWVKFLQLRKLILSRKYVPLSALYRMDVDDYVYMEQRNVNLPHKKQPSVTDDITMSLLEKIRTRDKKDVIPKKEFRHSLTPLTDYTDVVLKHCQDPETRLLLSEDFTQYSLKYACQSLDLRVADDSENIIVGVNESNKCIKSEIKSKLSSAYYIHRDCSLVFIRNCENKHWMKTKRPKPKHIKKVKTENDDEDVASFQDYSSDSDTSSTHDEADLSENDSCDKKLEFIEEDKSVNIFDDDFQNLVEYEPKDNIESIDIKEEPIDEENVKSNSQNGDLSHVDFENPVLIDDADNQSALPSSLDEDVLQFYNPETFNREGTIKHLILLACKKHKIPIPKEYRPIQHKEPRKRKIENVIKENNNDDVVPEKIPKTRAKTGEGREHVNILLSAYYDSLTHDIFSSVSHHVRDLVEGLERTREDFNTEDQVDGTFDNNLLDNNLESLRNETNQDETADNAVNLNSVDNTTNVDDPSIMEIQNQTLTHKGDPKFDDKIYDIKQLYLKASDENIENIFDICDDPDVDRIITQKIEEESVSLNKPPAKVDDKEDGFCDWDDELPLSEIKELMVERKKAQDDAYQNLKFLVTNRKEIKKNNYWVRQEVILSRVKQRVDSFTNEMKENYPKNFSFIITECAAMLDCTPFILFKYMVKIEKYLIPQC